MDIEGVLAITFLFGGGTLFLLVISPVGKALADRIRHGAQPLGAVGTETEVLIAAGELKNGGSS